MSFYYIAKCRNNRKLKKLIFFSNLKKCTSPANEFRLQKCKKKKIIFSNMKKFTSPASEFLLHKCRNKNDFFFQI